MPEIYWQNKETFCPLRFDCNDDLYKDCHFLITGRMKCMSSVFSIVIFLLKFMYSVLNCAQLYIKLLGINSPRLIANSKIMLLSQTI